MKNTLLDTLYFNRLPITGDAEIFLWYACSLNCRFCNQPHKDTTGISIEDIDKKIKLVKEFYQKSSLTTFVTTFLGGETFDNCISQELLDHLCNRLIELYQFASSIGKQINYDNSTNLIFSDPYRVLDFYQRLKDEGIKVQLTISYDIADRNLTANQFDLFKKNELVLAPFVDLASFVMSKNTVQKIIEGFEDPYFDYLYEKYPVSFSIFNDNEARFGKRNVSALRPDEPELLKAIDILARKYPKVYAIQQWKEQALKRRKAYNSCSMDKIVIYPDGRTSKCTEDLKCAGGCLATRLADQRNCLCCEYFKFCSVECFHSTLDDRVERVKPCLQKAIYDLLKG